MRIFFDYSNGLVTSYTFVDPIHQYSPLLQYCSAACSTGFVENDWDVEILSFLLRRGSNIHARSLLGDTCLHLCLRSLRSEVKTPFWFATEETLNRVRSSFVYLIQHGAD